MQLHTPEYHPTDTNTDTDTGVQRNTKLSFPSRSRLLVLQDLRSRKQSDNPLVLVLSRARAQGRGNLVSIHAPVEPQTDDTRVSPFDCSLPRSKACVEEDSIVDLVIYKTHTHTHTIHIPDATDVLRLAIVICTVPYCTVLPASPSSVPTLHSKARHTTWVLGPYRRSSSRTRNPTQVPPRPYGGCRFSWDLPSWSV